LNLCVFCAFWILSFSFAVSTATAGQKRLQLCESKALLGAELDWRAGGANRGAPAANWPLRGQIFSREAKRIALEVPPSDAKLRPNCRLLDEFVGTPPIQARANSFASFCGMPFAGASPFLNWAFAAPFLRVKR
jgi:hypothetical protein